MSAMLDSFIKLPRPQKRLISLVADTVCLSFAFWLALSLRLDKLYWTTSPGVFYTLGLTVLVTIGAFVKLGLYRAVIRYMSNHALMAVLSGVTISAVAMSSFSFLLQSPIPRSVPFIYWCLAMLFVGGSRMLVRSLVHRKLTQRKQKVIIYGAGSSGRQLALALAQGNEYQPVAFVDDDSRKHGIIVQGLRIYGPSQLPALLKKWEVSKVLLAITNATQSQRRSILRFLEALTVQVQTIPGMADLVSGKAQIAELRDIEIEDLLGRDPVQPNDGLLGACIRNKVVMVTGAGGSIGSELCRQIVLLRPQKLVLFEMSEFGLYQLEKELRAMVEGTGLEVELIPILGSVQKRRRLQVVMETFGVQTVYHAAAYKHVPIVEYNVIEGVRNNIFGTWFAAEAAVAAGVETFVLISTDKAVRPTNVMGTTKRIAELVLQALADRQNKTRFCMVRFGNVLGSSGSVVPLFREQIRKGGPVTVTHPDIIRYFMTIPEASQLVLQAGSMGQGGEVFVLDMGEQVRIDDLARKMIRLMGYEVRDEQNPDGDIEIAYTGLRPGEKLYEELLIGDNPEPTSHPRIMKAREIKLTWPEIEAMLQALDNACKDFDCGQVHEIILKAPTGYQPTHEVKDLVWCGTAAQAAKRITENGQVDNLIVLDGRLKTAREK